jgi:hypothetical protein
MRISEVAPQVRTLLPVQAIAEKGGEEMSMVRNLFARVDVALPAYWTDDGNTAMVVPMINEVSNDIPELVTLSTRLVEWPRGFSNGV